MILKFKRIRVGAILPSYAHPSDAGMDICSAEDVIIPSRGRSIVHTGLCMQLPPLYEAQVRPRSGLALKNGITVLNTPGTIDSGYRGEIGVVLANMSDIDFQVRKGDRIAQLVIAPVIQPEICEVDVIDESDRGEGGFGSTGL